jgi:non-specific serine/threonine protein kinase
MASRLDDRFQLLSGRARSVPLRHQTLRATIDWSYGLLVDEERRVLQGLSLFSGGCTLDAAEAVLTSASEGSGAVLDLVHQLVDKSLVVVVRGMDTRYQLLETIQQYAREKLTDSGQGEVLEARHHQWFLRLAERAADELQGPKRNSWLRSLEEDHDNLRAVLGWSLASSEEESCLRMAEALSCFWLRQGHLREGRSWLMRALAGTASSFWRARGLSGAAALAFEQGDYDEASLLGDEALVLFEEVGDRCREAHVRCLLGRVARGQGDLGRAGALTGEGLVMFRGLKDQAGMAAAMRDLGTVARAEGDHVRARGLLEEGLALLDELHRSPSLATAEGQIGPVPVAQARDRSLVLSELALVVGMEGDYGRATTLLEESLGLSGSQASKVGTAACLEGLAGLAAQQGEVERCAVLLGAAEALRHTMGGALPSSERVERERLMARIETDLGRQASSDARLRGWAMGESEAVAFARSRSKEPV